MFLVLAYFLAQSHVLQVVVAIALPCLILAQWERWREEGRLRNAWHSQPTIEKMRQSGLLYEPPPSGDNQPPL